MQRHRWASIPRPTINVIGHSSSKPLSSSQPPINSEQARKRLRRSYLLPSYVSFSCSISELWTHSPQRQGQLGTHTVITTCEADARSHLDLRRWHGTERFRLTISLDLQCQPKALGALQDCSTLGFKRPAGAIEWRAAMSLPRLSTA
jgi:hypothetical protein